MQLRAGVYVARAVYVCCDMSCVCVVGRQVVLGLIILEGLCCDCVLCACVYVLCLCCVSVFCQCLVSVLCLYIVPVLCLFFVCVMCMVSVCVSGVVSLYLVCVLCPRVVWYWSGVGLELV